MITQRFDRRISCLGVLRTLVQATEPRFHYSREDASM